MAEQPTTNNGYIILILNGAPAIYKIEFPNPDKPELAFINNIDIDLLKNLAISNFINTNWKINELHIPSNIMANIGIDIRDIYKSLNDNLSNIVNEIEIPVITSNEDNGIIVDPTVINTQQPDSTVATVIDQGSINITKVNPNMIDDITDVKVIENIGEEIKKAETSLTDALSSLVENTKK